MKKEEMKRILLFVTLLVVVQSLVAQSFALIKNPLSLGLDAKFTEVNSGDVEFVDVDGDGDQDVMISGQIHYSQGVSHTTLYINDGLGNFEKSANNFIGMGWSSLVFGDVDGDNDVDVIITGETSDQDQPLQTLLYLNDGAGVFTQTNESFIGTMRGDIAFTDVDSDGDLDVLLTGGTTALYKNDGSGHFAEVTSSFELMSLSNMAIGDVDGDGDDDVVISGYKQAGGSDSFLYLNDGTGGYTKNNAVSFLGATEGTTELADIDGDGDLDALISGSDGGSYFMLVYLNDGAGVFGTGSAVMPVSKELFTYKMYDFDVDGDLDIVSPAGIFMNNGSGEFTLDAMSSTFRRLKDGAVAISDVNGDNLDDVIFLGRDGVINHTSLYMHGAGHTLTEVMDNYFGGLQQGDVQLVDLDGDGDMDIVAYGKTNEDAFQHVLKTYQNDGMGNFTEFVSGLDVYHGEKKVVYGDLDGDGDLDIIVGDSYYDGKLDLWLNDGSGHFAQQSIVAEENIFWRGLDLHDFDGDGDLDLFYIAYNHDTSVNYTKLMKNDGNGQFTYFETGLVSRNSDVLAVGDIDSDGDFDVILNARNGSGNKTYICKNNNDGTFVETYTPNIAAKIAGTMVLADVNGDDNLDLYVSGQNYSSGTSAIIYKNNGFGSFSVYTNTVGVNFGSADFADMDNDGDLDLLVTGSSSAGGNSPRVARLYENKGLDGFEVVEDTIFTNVLEGAAALGDMDGDGDKDIVMIGSYVFGSIFHIFDNQLVMVALSEKATKAACNVYPNPSSDWVHFRTAKPIVSVAIYNQLGQLVKLQSEAEIDVSELKSGVFYCRIEFLDGTFVGANFVKD